MKFFIIDAFAESLFGGNPAGVVIMGEEEAFPDARVMQNVAAELRYSETVFVKHESENEYILRFFTVTDEVDLCGHATIAAFFIVQDMERIQDTGESGNVENPCAERVWTAITNAGRLRIESRQGVIFMEMAPATDIAVISDEGLMAEICACTGLNMKDVSGPVELISTGLPDMILPLKSTEILHGMKPDFAKMSEISEQLGIVGIHAFALPDVSCGLNGVTEADAKHRAQESKQPDTEHRSAYADAKHSACELTQSEAADKAHGSTHADERHGAHGSAQPAAAYTVHCRNFAPLYGIDEEAATGTANGALCRYLYKNGLITDNSLVNFIQGEAIDRPSMIRAIVSLSGETLADGAIACGGEARLIAENRGVSDSNINKLRIQIGGSCALLARGELYL